MVAPIYILYIFSYWSKQLYILENTLIKMIVLIFGLLNSIVIFKVTRIKTILFDLFQVFSTFFNSWNMFYLANF